MHLQKIFNRLQGLWYFTRTLQSKHHDFPSGTVKGQATFTSTAKNTLHYKETGEFTTTQQETFKINKEYLYLYMKDQIEKHFIETSGNRLFYVLKFSQPKAAAAKSPSATGEHLCAQDKYHAKYRFLDENFDTFTLTYQVKGPKKEYTSETVFTRKQLP